MCFARLRSILTQGFSQPSRPELTLSGQAGRGANQADSLTYLRAQPEMTALWPSPSHSSGKPSPTTKKLACTSFECPWQDGVGERWIESCRRDLLDHLIALNEQHLKRLLSDYVRYYEGCRTYLTLEKDAPIGRPIQPPALGQVIEIPQVGGLHHLYTRKAA